MKAYTEVNHNGSPNFQPRPPQAAASAPAHVFVTDFATRRVKQNHQQLQHVVNRMTARMGFPDKAARAVTGLHGLLNGRETFPALIAHKYAARQLNYSGKDENSDGFMGRYLDALKDAEFKAGRKCFEIERANGVTTIITTYHHDFIGEAALWALTAAQASEAWMKHPAKAVTDDLIDRAIAKLPAVEPPVARDTSDGPSVTDGATIKGIWTKVDTLTEAAMRKVAEAGGDPLAALEVAQRRQRRIAVEVRREQLARDKAAKDAELYATLDWLADTDAHPDGTNISDDFEKFSTGNDRLSDADHPSICRMDFAKAQQKGPLFSEFCENSDSLHTTCATDSEAEVDPPKLTAALQSIAAGIPVLALCGVSDGICDCPQGSECRSAGKHPYARFAPNGSHSATLDAATARMWFAKDPRINFGQSMGGALNLFCVDIDPRNEGDASYHDLISTHGEDAFPETREKTTGGGGWHKLYRLSKPIQGTGELKAKLAPGVDLKGSGGYIVAPLGDHVSGRPYGAENGLEIAFAPRWMEAEIVKAAEGERPSRPIKFQATKGRMVATVGARTFPEGERNNGIRDFACGRWVHGWAESEADLIQQTLEANATRCVPPLPESEAIGLARSAARKYARGLSEVVQ
jgi:hypothetical protein